MVAATGRRKAAVALRHDWCVLRGSVPGVTPGVQVTLTTNPVTLATIPVAFEVERALTPIGRGTPGRPSSPAANVTRGRPECRRLRAGWRPRSAGPHKRRVESRRPGPPCA